MLVDIIFEFLVSDTVRYPTATDFDSGSNVKVAHLEDFGKSSRKKWLQKLAQRGTSRL